MVGLTLEQEVKQSFTGHQFELHGSLLQFRISAQELQMYDGKYDLVVFLSGVVVRTRNDMVTRQFGEYARTA